MSWPSQLKGNPLAWLLEPDPPGVAYLARRELLPPDEESADFIAARRRAYQEGPIAEVLSAMDPAGYWVKPGPGYLPKYRSTAWSIILLAQLGARAADDARIGQACRYLLDQALAPGGQLSISGAPSGTIDCLQGNLCGALLDLGYEDPRLDGAFEWMARTVTGEGIAPVADRKAPLRYYAYKCGPLFACGPNLKLPCAWGAVKVVLAFGKLPLARRTPLVERAVQQGVDFLFSVDPATAAYPMGMATKPNQAWWKLGFPVFYITDLLQLLEALARLGYGRDPRLEKAWALIWEKQDAQGRWALEYDYAGKTWGEYGKKKQGNKWVTERVMRVVRVVEQKTEPRARHGFLERINGSRIGEKTEPRP